LKALGAAARRQRRRHRVIIMIDVGDLREGLWPDQTEDFLHKASKIGGIEVDGLGCTLGCFGGVIPSISNMELFVATARRCRKATGLPLPILSAGNSSGISILTEGRLPREINHYRLGESILLGRDATNRQPLPQTRQDAVRLVVEVIEVGQKPSVPIGERGQDAFGAQPVFIERGIRTRAICNLGRQDTDIEGLTPDSAGVSILGASGDHLILDIHDHSQALRVGDELSFWPNYSSLLRLSASDYVRKVVL
jgi:predicted amino acid racemase